MSKRLHKSRPKNRNVPVYFYLLVGGGLVMVVGLIFGLGLKPNKGTPVLAVDPTRIEFGSVKLGMPLTFEIKVTNTGNGVLKFKEKPYIEVLEGC